MDAEYQFSLGSCSLHGFQSKRGFQGHLLRSRSVILAALGGGSLQRKEGPLVQRRCYPHFAPLSLCQQSSSEVPRPHSVESHHFHCCCCGQVHEGQGYPCEALRTTPRLRTAALLGAGAWSPRYCSHCPAQCSRKAGCCLRACPCLMHKVIVHI